ncbi:hypothetical protein O6H91_13G077100 [Diphasiastrum complanatum]|uniref:Uncharacterized protein n=2 Tax=Diphasiastrum complanatum TaxID=34168 RepID=A0ACC2BWF9_DIPCM|nr:hypothetical protein O6H91_13G077100 [Diphasiastrum complanatum]KAJ7534050.1 hypothetical protein O6H91_13G077100 [Diphasiastrum complanatum]
MWSWATDGTVDIPEANWSPGNEYDYMLWERLGENNDSIAPDSEELLQDAWTNGCKRLHRREPSFSSPRMLETISSETGKLSNSESKLVLEDCSAEINNFSRQSPALVDLETVVSLRTQGCDGFSLADEKLQRQNKDAASQSISQEQLLSFNTFHGKPSVDIIDIVKSGKDESSLTSLDRLALPDVSSSEVEKNLYEEVEHDDRAGAVNNCQWEHIGIMEDMENFLEGSDSSVGEAGVSKPYSLQWSSPLSPSTPATFISNIAQTGETSPGLMGSHLNGELKLNGIASTSSTSAGALEKTGGSFRDRFFLSRAKNHEDQFQPLTLPAELQQRDYLPSQLSARRDLNATTVPQSNGLTLQDAPVALADNVQAQGAQALSFSCINKAKQMGGQPAKRMWSEEMRNIEFSPRNIQYLSLGETPRPADLALQHSLPVQQSPRPLPLSSSIHEILPLPDAGVSPQAVLQQLPHYSQQLPMPFMPQLHPHALLSSPSSITQQVQLRQAYVDPYQHPHPPPLEKQQFNPQPSTLSDSPVRPPLSGTNMTPQEKIEKLRWRQQIQAKLAVEEKKHQLSNVSPSVGYETFEIQHPAQVPRVARLDQMLYNKQQSQQQPLAPINVEEGAARIAAAHFLPRTSQEIKHNHGGIDGKEPTSNTDLNSREKASHLDAALFHQVESVIMQLDIRTRLSMRDALYRLASSAMQRRAVNDSSSGEREPSSHMSRFAGASTLEAPTNPIDRTIANLLFHKQPVSSPKSQVYPLSTADARIPTSPSAIGHSRLWAMQTPGAEAHLNWGIPMQGFAFVSNGQNVDFSRSF